MKDFEEFDEFDEGQESVDLLPYIRTALKSWKTLLLWASCAAVMGIVIGFSTPRTYTTRAVVAPELTTRANSGGLSSLASLAGINMNSLALTDAMHPDLYPEIISSTNFYIDLFDMPVTIVEKDSTITTDLYDYIANHTRQPWWNYVLGAPRMAVGAVKNLFSSADEFEDAEGHACMDSLRLTRQQEMVVKYMHKNITASVEKKTYVLSLKVTMQDRMVAADLANYVVEKLQKFVLRYRTEKTQETVDYYEKIYEETHADYLAAQKAYAYYADTHQGVVSQGARVELQHLQNEAQLKYQMYNQTAQNLLAARAKVQQESPVLVVIQSGWAPQNGKPSKVRLAVLWFILGGGLGIGFVFWRAKKDGTL